MDVVKLYQRGGPFGKVWQSDLRGPRHAAVYMPEFWPGENYGAKLVLTTCPTVVFQVACHLGRSCPQKILRVNQRDKL